MRCGIQQAGRKPPLRIAGTSGMSRRGPFAERFKPQLTIRAKPCHGDMGGVLLLKLPLLGLDAGIPLRVKCLGIDFCHNNNYLLCCVKVIRINMDGRIRITKIISADHAKIVQTNG